MGNFAPRTPRGRTTPRSSPLHNYAFSFLESDKEVKVLLLGAGCTGKSTVFKQLRIMYQDGFKEDDCLMYREVIFGNILKSIMILVRQTLVMQLPIQDPKNKERADRINNLDNEALLNVEKVWTPDLTNDIKELWRDPSIVKVWERRNEYQIDSCASYFFDQMDRIAQLSYVPTQQDVIHSRVKTTGIVEWEFKLNGKNVRAIDTGGQRNERKKWIHCFDDVSCVIFFVSMEEYDQLLYEDDSTNRMCESLLLFDEIVNSRWFVNSSIVLVMNKVDLFREKIRTKSLKQAFPHYHGGNSYTKAVMYIKEMFESKNRNKQKKIYTIMTEATNSDTLREAFESVVDVMLGNQSVPFAFRIIPEGLSNVPERMLEKKQFYDVEIRFQTISDIMSPLTNFEAYDDIWLGKKDWDLS